MPELPEVEVIRRQAHKALAGKKIDRIEVYTRSLVRTPLPAFKRSLKGAVVKSVSRRAKYLLFEFVQPLVLLVHLKMTGQLLYSPTRKKDKHTHVIFRFSDGTYLHYSDVRKFGSLWLYSQDSLAKVKELKALGLEPLGPECNWDKFQGMLSEKKGRIKPLLMDQSFISGIGNIYSDEVLFQARVHPLRKVESLKPGECKEIFHAIKDKLEEGIRRGGSSVDDYRDLFGDKGTMQDHLEVYGRKGQKCLRCGLAIKTARLSGRTTHFCDYCQK